MSVGDSRHCDILGIRGRHFVETAKEAGLGPTLTNVVFEEIESHFQEAFDKVESELTKPTERRIECVLRHRTLPALYGWKDIRAVDVALLRLFENRQRLPGQRDDVLIAHLHFAGRNAPDGFLEVDLRPFSMAQFARAHKNMRKQLQGQSGRQMARILINGSQKPADGLWIDQSGIMLGLLGHQCHAEVGGGVKFGAARNNRVFENALC